MIDLAKMVRNNKEVVLGFVLVHFGILVVRIQPLLAVPVIAPAILGNRFQNSEHLQNFFVD